MKDKTHAWIEGVNRGPCGCIEINHLFDVSAISTDQSEIFTSVMMEELLGLFEYRGTAGEPVVGAGDLSVTIFGRADGHQFAQTASIPFDEQLLPIRNHMYYSKNKDLVPRQISFVENQISPRNLAHRNEQLAFIRAYKVKDKLVDTYGFHRDSFNIITYTSDEKLAEDRLSQTTFCHESLSPAILADVQQRVERIMEENTPPPLVNEAEGEEQEPLPAQAEIKIPEEEAATRGVQIIPESARELRKNLILTSDSREIDPYFDELYHILNNNQRLLVEVRVHTNAGKNASEQESIALSEERTESISRYLITRGISPDRIITIEYGSHPLLEGRKTNQWVEISY